MKKITSAHVLIALVAILIAAVVFKLYPAPATPGPAPTPAPQPVTGTKSLGRCVVGGCSGEVCSDASGGSAITTCLYLPEYACYKTATCERQTNGACGWTHTAELSACLANPPAIK